MQPWAASELADLSLGDKRLDKRIVVLLESLSHQPGASLPQVCGTWGHTKAAYRFFASDRVQVEAIEAAHQRSICQRIAQAALPRVLAIQDTTELDFTSHHAMEGLGHLSAASHQGLRVHSVLCASTAGMPLGLLHQSVGARDPKTRGQSKDWRKRATSDKESQRWIDALVTTEALLPQELNLLTVADREADFYDLFAAPRRRGSDLLIRAAYDRRVTAEARRLFAQLQQAPLCGRQRVLVRRHDQERPAREALVSLRHAPVEILPPRYSARDATRLPLSLWAVLAQEEEPPSGVKPLLWLLLTTCPVQNSQAAQECLHCYALRWLIERYHFVLKSGCRIEALQLARAQRMRRALALYSLVAWRLLWLSCQARQEPGSSCTTVLAAHEWQALWCRLHPGQAPPEEPPSLSQAVRWIAGLGGFLARKSDGEPGVETLWRGLRRLDDIAATWQLLRQCSPDTYG